MLSETAPKLGLGPSLQRVCSEPDHPKALTGVGTRFAGLQEEVDASGRPPDSAGALGKSARSGRAASQAIRTSRRTTSSGRFAVIGGDLDFLQLGMACLGGVPP